MKRKQILLQLRQRLQSIPKKTLQQMLLALAASLLLTVLVFFSSLQNASLVSGNSLRRSSYGKSDSSYSLDVHGLLQGKTVPVTVSVGAKRYTREEADEIFRSIVENIEEEITAPEESLDAVYSNLTLPTSFPEYGVQASWRFYPEMPAEDIAAQEASDAAENDPNSAAREPTSGSDEAAADEEEEAPAADETDTAAAEEQRKEAQLQYFQRYSRLIDEDGTVNNENFAEDESAEGYLSLVLSAYILPEEGGETDYLKIRYKSDTYKLYIRILPRSLSEEQKLLSALEQSIADSNEQNMNEELLQLPSEVLGHRLSYSEKTDQTYLLFPLLGLVLAAGIYMQRGARLKEERQQRETQLMLDYSELVSKLIVYLGAGLTVRNSFEKIISHFDELVEKGLHENRFLYDELRILSRQLSRGIPESTVYLDFSRRINLKPYTKLISLIEQNRKNGSKNMKALLSLEMEEAFEQRKTTARRLGEEAGTRLLLPLFLQLGIVMAIVIVPAMTSLS